MEEDINPNWFVDENLEEALGIEPQPITEQQTSDEDYRYMKQVMQGDTSDEIEVSSWTPVQKEEEEQKEKQSTRRKRKRKKEYNRKGNYE